MGIEATQQIDRESLESRPGILIVGSSNVGKRTLLSRLLSVDLSDAPELSSGILCYGWTIDTKYYSANLSIWMAHLGDEFSFSSISVSKQLDALVMVFDLSDLSSFATLQEWVSGIDVQKFEILLCIGNKADLLPGHFAHSEYRRRLQKRGELSSDPHPEYLDYGILETEGSSLLGDEEKSSEIRRLCLEWCSQHNIEYIEACASNADFDKCLSINGDSQGVERLYGALSANMWPGMILKSRNQIPESSPVDKEDVSDEESEFEIEYELLSHGSAEPWDGMDESWVALNDLPTTSDTKEVSVHGNAPTSDQDERHKKGDAVELQASSISEVPVEKELDIKADDTSAHKASGTEADEASEQEASEPKASILPAQGQSHAEATEAPVEVPEDAEAEVLVREESETNEDMSYNFEDVEQLMCEISHMRENLRLLPDFQRKEMAAKLAMKMANMFADSSDEEGYN
ncbi:hypothetical protein AAC387_Pa07g1143 [Persea americana]